MFATSPAAKGMRCRVIIRSPIGSFVVRTRVRSTGLRGRVLTPQSIGHFGRGRDRVRRAGLRGRVLNRSSRRPAAARNQGVPLQQATEAIAPSVKPEEPHAVGPPRRDALRPLRGRRPSDRADVPLLTCRAGSGGFAADRRGETPARHHSPKLTSTRPGIVTVDVPGATKPSVRSKGFVAAPRRCRRTRSFGCCH
jgi:hypothetical protein